MLLRITIFLYLAAISFTFAHGPKKKSVKAHEHGVGILNIAQEGKNLLFEFEVPGFDIVGFEYKAESESDIQKVNDSINTLKNYVNLVKPSGSANCSEMESSAKVIYEGNHSEFISSYKLNCENIADLKIIYIKYFKNFPLSKKLNVKIFGNDNKTAYVIDKKKKMINVKGFFK